MSRLCAIAMFCTAVCFPAFAQEEEQAPPAADTRELSDLTAEILEELDPELIVQMLLTRAEDEAVENEFEGSVMHREDVVVPLALFLTILLVVMSNLALRYRKHAQIQETLRLMIEKGSEIPPELLTPPMSQYGDLRRGLVLLGAGLSLSILIGVMHGFGSGSWAVGLIPAFIGAGYLIVWRYAQRNEAT